MSIFQTDSVFRTILQTGFDDIRKNEWLVDHILANFTCIPLLQDKYGQRQIESCKEFLRNNEVPIVMDLRNDSVKMPQIVVSIGPGEEEAQMMTMGDRSTETVELLPNVIGKPIPYVVKPFTGYSYNSTTGEITIPDSVDYSTVSGGMLFVDPSTGTGYRILDSTPDGLQLETDLDITATSLGVVPQFQFYKARIEHTWSRENVYINVESHGDPQVVLWLHSIILYTIFRYREGLLEANGFNETRVSYGPLQTNNELSGAGGEVGYSRTINVKGLVEQTWLKAPHRIIESIALREKDEQGDGYHGGVKILSNADSTLGYDTNWTTVEE